MSTPQDRLSCGRFVEDLVNQIADGRGDDRDEHQVSCPHCQAALGEFTRIWEPFRELRSRRVTAPDGVLESALDRIRKAVEHPDYGVLTSPHGTTRISARVVVVAARHSAEQVPGVRVALSRHLTDPTGTPTAAGADVTAGVAGRSTAIEITLAADYGTDLVALGDQVRAHVTRQVRTLTDLEPVQVTVIIDDVFD